MGDFRYSTSYTNTFVGGIKPATAVDYSYDANGNLTSDKNKDIASITYNYLNLPSVVSFGAKGSITYTYDAGGNKTKKITVDNSVSGKTFTATTTYIAGFVYESKTITPVDPNNPAYTDRVQFFGQEEGRARALYTNAASPGNLTGFAYDYMLKDQLGNTRMLITEEAAAPNIYPH